MIEHSITLSARVFPLTPFEIVCHKVTATTKILQDFKYEIMQDVICIDDRDYDPDEIADEIVQEVDVTTIEVEDFDLPVATDADRSIIRVMQEREAIRRLVG